MTSSACKIFEPTPKFVRSLKGEPISQTRYHKLKSELRHIRIHNTSEDVFTRSLLNVNLTDWHSAVHGLSEKLDIDTSWIKTLTTAYQRWQRMECNGTNCVFRMINFAIEGSGLKHLFGLFGVKLCFSCHPTDSLFGGVADVSLVEDGNRELEVFRLIDREKLKEFIMIKSLILIKPFVDEFFAN